MIIPNSSNFCSRSASLRAPPGPCPPHCGLWGLTRGKGQQKQVWMKGGDLCTHHTAQGTLWTSRNWIPRWWEAYVVKQERLILTEYPCRLCRAERWDDRDRSTMGPGVGGRVMSSLIYEWMTFSWISVCTHVKLDWNKRQPVFCLAMLPGYRD